MFCSNCGKNLPDNAHFCDACGAQVALPAQEQPVKLFETPPAQPAPVASDEPVPVMAPVPVKKKKPVLAILLPIVLVAAAAVAVWILFFGKETVYLCTEMENTSGPYSNVTTDSYEYNDDGRLVFVEHYMELPEMAYGEDSYYEISYDYDQKGNLESAEFDVNGKEFEVEYLYRDDVLVGVEVDGLPDMYDEDSFVVECDKDGNIERVYVEFAAGFDGSITWEFEYHDNGVLKCIEYENTLTGREYVNEYDKKGTLRVSETSTLDQYRMKNEYDAQGNLVMMEQYDNNGDPMMILKVETEFDGKQLCNLVLNLSGPEDMFGKSGVDLVFDCEWDGLACDLNLDEIDYPKDFDEDMIEEIESTLEDAELEISFELNEAGNLISGEMEAMSMTVMSFEREFQKFRVARGTPNDKSNPIYLAFLSEL